MPVPGGGVGLLPDAAAFFSRGEAPRQDSAASSSRSRPRRERRRHLLPASPFPFSGFRTPSRLTLEAGLRFFDSPEAAGREQSRRHGIGRSPSRHAVHAGRLRRFYPRGSRPIFPGRGPRPDSTICFFRSPPMRERQHPSPNRRRLIFAIQYEAATNRRCRFWAGNGLIDPWRPYPEASSRPGLGASGYGVGGEIVAFPFAQATTGFNSGLAFKKYGYCLPERSLRRIRIDEDPFCAQEWRAVSRNRQPRPDGRAGMAHSWNQKSEPPESRHESPNPISRLSFAPEVQRPKSFQLKLFRGSSRDKRQRILARRLFRAALSSFASASRRFSSAFSASRSFRRRNSATPKPP